MALLTAQAIARTGLATAYATPTVADTFPNDGNTFLHVKNTNGSPRDVTVSSKAVPGIGLAAADLVVTVAATTGDVMIGPFPPAAFNDPVTGLVSVAYSATAGVTAAVVQLPST